MKTFDPAFFKNDNFVLVNFKGPLYCKQTIMDICLTLLENGIALNTIINNIFKIFHAIFFVLFIINSKLSILSGDFLIK